MLEHKVNPDEDLFVEYWTAFNKTIGKSKIKIQVPKSQNWIDSKIDTGKGATLARAAYPDKNEIAVYLQFYEKDTAASYLNALKINQERIAAELSYQLTWVEDHDRKFYCVRTSIPADVKDRSQWEVQHAWMRQVLQDFRKVLTPYLKRLAIIGIKTPFKKMA